MGQVTKNETLFIFKGENGASRGNQLGAGPSVEQHRGPKTYLCPGEGNGE